MARWVPTLPASKSGKISDGKVNAKKSAEPWKDSKWQGRAEPQWQESKRSIRERDWKQRVEFAEGGEKFTVWMASQEMDDDTMALWCEWFVNYMQPEAGKEVEAVFATEVDFSKNSLTAVGVSALLAALLKLGVAVQVLKLHANRIEADGGFARWIVGNRGSLRGLHLARNKLDTESATSIALAILDAHDAEGTPCYPVRQRSRGVAAVPFWLRIEWNHVDPAVFNERVETAFRASRRLGRAFCNADYGCSPWTCSGHPGCPAVMHAWYLNSQHEPSETAVPIVVQELSVGDLDVARAAKLAARPGKSGPRKQANPAPAATTGSTTAPSAASSGDAGGSVQTVHEEAPCQADKLSGTKTLGDDFGKPVSSERPSKAGHETAEPTPESIAEPMPEPLSEDALAEERSTKPSAEPVLEPTAEPSNGRSRWRPVKKVAEPLTKPITEPVAEPVAEPVSEQAAETAMDAPVVEPPEELAVRAAVRIELLVQRINQAILKHALRLCGPALQAMAAEARKAKKALADRALAEKAAAEEKLRRQKEEAEIVEAVIDTLKRKAQSLEASASALTASASSFEPSGSSSTPVVYRDATTYLPPWTSSPCPGPAEAGHATMDPQFGQSHTVLARGKRANKMRHHIPLPKAPASLLPATGDLLKAAVRSEANAPAESNLTRNSGPSTPSHAAADGPKPAGRVEESGAETDAQVLAAAERRQALLKRYGAAHSDVAGVMSL